MSARLLMLLDFLKGEHQAKGILADMIEEDGDSTLAATVRNRKSRQKKIFQLGLEIIPFDLATKVSVHYFRHAISRSRVAPPSALNENLDSIERWIDQCANTQTENSNEENFELEQELEAACANLRTMYSADRLSVLHGRISFIEEQIHDSIGQLLHIIDIARLIVIAQRDHDHSLAKRSSNRLRTEIVRGASRFRILATRFKRRREWAADATSMEFGWQWQHLVESIEAVAKQAYE